MLRSLRILIAVAFAALRLHAAPEITEFMAENDGVLLDSDGASSDWIEIANPAATSVVLTNWALTDDAALPLKWRFPAVTLPPGGMIVVFASGKNRAVSGAQLHTNFSLGNGGDYLALVRPDGTVSMAFSPKYPPQRSAASFGTGRRDVVPALVSAASAASVLIPTNNALGTSWTAEGFNDGAWTHGFAAIGYDDLTGDASSTLMGSWDFNTTGNILGVLDGSGHGNHGVVTGATFTAAGGGRSGAAGDRAMDFGPGGTGKNMRVSSAATGAFDAAVTADKLTVSLWTFGAAELPANNSVFYGTQASDGTGKRVLNVHLPWSDGNIYWDTGTGETADTRIYGFAGDAAGYKGRWNHYVFLKDGPRREVWQNGVLKLSGDAGAPLNPMRGFWIGAAYSGVINFPGKIDDFGIWSSALSTAEIAALAAGSPPLTIGTYAPLIGTDLRTAMKGVSASALLRVPFTLPAAPDFDALTLRLRYDDGCIVYLNGVEVVRRNVSPSATAGSLALGNRLKRDVLVPEEIDLSTFVGLLHAGANVLAIHGFNDALNSGDFLIVPELSAVHRLANRYFTTPTPGRLNNAGYAGFIADTAFTLKRGYYDAPFQTAVTTPTVGASVIHTTDGSEPAPGHGTTTPAPGPVVSIPGTTGCAD